ncbi:MAG: hypothetical protein WC414_00815 [Patescibacteria group bacterium]
MEENLQIAKEKVMNKMFQLMLKIAVIFALPAFISFFVGSYFDKMYNIKPKITLILLFISFLLSWVIVIYLYQKINKELIELRKKEILQVKEKQKQLQEKIKNN